MTDVGSGGRRGWSCYASLPDLFPQRTQGPVCCDQEALSRVRKPAPQSVGDEYGDCGVLGLLPRLRVDSLLNEQRTWDSKRTALHGSADMCRRTPFAVGRQTGDGRAECVPEQVNSGDPTFHCCENGPATLSNKLLTYQAGEILCRWLSEQAQQAQCRVQIDVPRPHLTVDTAAVSMATEAGGACSGGILSPGAFSYFSSGSVFGFDEGPADAEVAAGCQRGDSLSPEGSQATMCNLVQNESPLGKAVPGGLRDASRVPKFQLFQQEPPIAQSQSDVVADDMQSMTEEDKQLLLRELFESYFSDRRIWGLIQNLSSRAISHSGWCSIVPITQFAKVRAISTSMTTIVNAIRQSNVLEISHDGKRVRRTDRPNLLAAIAGARSWRNTVYMLGLPKTAHECDVARHFSAHGRIVAVTLCPSVADSPTVALVEFLNAEMAAKCIAQGRCHFNGSLVEIVSRRAAKRKWTGNGRDAASCGQRVLAQHTADGHCPPDIRRLSQPAVQALQVDV